MTSLVQFTANTVWLSPTAGLPARLHEQLIQGCLIIAVHLILPGPAPAAMLTILIFICTMQSVGCIPSMLQTQYSVSCKHSRHGALPEVIYSTSLHAGDGGF